MISLKALKSGAVIFSSFEFVLFEVSVFTLASLLDDVFFLFILAV